MQLALKALGLLLPAALVLQRYVGLSLVHSLW
jgi:hypothetical protein